MKLYGKNSVLERLKTNPRSIRKIFLEPTAPDGSYIRKKAKKWGIPIIGVQRSNMLKLARNANTQGILADIDDFSYVLLDDLLDQVRTQGLSLIFLDNITDPQNLGAIIRSLACLGDFAIVLPTHRSVEVTESVLRVASGGDNFISVAKVSNLSNAIKSARDAGLWVVGAVAEGGTDLMEANFAFPLGLVMGSEQKGIRDVVRKHLDGEITIPMAQPRLSFNVAQATTVICYEIAKQKKAAGAKK